MRCVAEYRICRKSESHYDLTEECFQGKDPSRGGPLTLTDDSWIQYGNEKNRSHFKPTRECLGAFSSSLCTAEAYAMSALAGTTTGTYPPNSQWSKNPISLCGDPTEGVEGIFDDGCNTTKYPTQFKPVAPGAYGFWGVYKLGAAQAGIGRLHALSVIDRVNVPDNLGAPRRPPGRRPRFATSRESCGEDQPSAQMLRRDGPVYSQLQIR